MAKVGNRQNKTIKCSVCNSENYRKERNVKNTTERLELNKYCSKCGKHTTHKEKK
ncbi:MAG: 50S ribosomal protein L33 [Bacilli bacterium]|nr:50S ribosomal protein L33 [Bacilli bacterium]